MKIQKAKITMNGERLMRIETQLRRSCPDFDVDAVVLELLVQIRVFTGTKVFSPGWVLVRSVDLASIDGDFLDLPFLHLGEEFGKGNLLLAAPLAGFGTREHNNRQADEHHPKDQRLEY